MPAIRSPGRPPLAARQAGRSLVETMIALSIGAVLTGAVLLTVSGTGMSGRKQDAQATLTEHGQVALNLLAAPLRMAGFWQPTSEVVSLDAPPDANPMLFGCRNGFLAPDAAWDALDCTPGAGPGAIAVRYQAGELGTDMALDCSGQDVRALGLDEITDRYFVRLTGTPTGNPALYCQPSGGGDAALLIDNIESMTVGYGISAVAAGPLSNRAFDPAALEGRTTRYVDASTLVADCTPGAIPANSWCAVTTVNLCILVRSDDNATDTTGGTYVDCAGNVTASPDRRLRRAMTTTVTLRNRVAPSLIAAGAP